MQHLRAISRRGLLFASASNPSAYQTNAAYFSPRFGFAWTPGGSGGKTSIRGGFGMYYDRIEGNIIFPVISNPPFINSASFENGNLANIRGGAASAITKFATISAIDPKLKTPYSMNFSLGVQRELWWGLFAEANFVGRRNPRRQSEQGKHQRYADGDV